MGGIQSLSYTLYITHKKYGKYVKISKDTKYPGSPIDAISKYDVSSLASEIKHYTSLSEQPGKLSFILEKDPNDILQIDVGDMVEFIVKDKLKTYNVFKGYVFNIGTDSTEAYKVTAYDQTRYLKNHDTMVINATKPMTLNSLFDEICSRNDIKSKKALSISTEQLPNKIYEDSSYFDILNDNMMNLLSKSEHYFFIKDNFGVLELNELSNCKTNLVIGDESLLTDYKYEVDIDKDTYNDIKIIGTSGSKSKAVLDLQYNQDSQNRYGVLRKIINTQNQVMNSTLKLKAQEFLQLHKDPTKTISLNAIGVNGLDAGNGFRLRLNKLGIEQDMWIESAVHHYDANVHTMELEVSGLIMNENSLDLIKDITSNPHY